MSRSRRPRCSSDVTRQLIDAAIEQGWRVEHTAGNHIVFYPKDKTKTPIYTASTAGDVRGPRNLRSQLRAAGLELTR